MTAFADLHRGPDPLCLPNAWDVPSALALAAAGFEAVGTTSFGVASCLGTPDGDRSTREANLRLAEQLAPLPVMLTVDSEDGYSDDPGEVAAYVARLAALGVVGVNLEDSLAGRLVDLSLVSAKIVAVKERSPEVFVNARVDNYWFHEDDDVDHVVARATAYVDAGADGVFVPGVTDSDTIRAVAAAVTVPLNVLAVPGTTLAELGRLGVRRVSTGSLPYRAAVQAGVLAAEAVRDGVAPPPAPSYATLQERMVDFARR
jgi:2-methylisocitrate lyase-like PEP mutase family enzyme